MKYYINGKEIAKEEAEKIEKENQKIFNKVSAGLLEFSELEKCKFVVKIA